MKRPHIAASHSQPPPLLFFLPCANPAAVKQHWHNGGEKKKKALCINKILQPQFDGRHGINERMRHIRDERLLMCTLEASLSCWGEGGGFQVLQWFLQTLDALRNTAKHDTMLPRPKTSRHSPSEETTGRKTYNTRSNSKLMKGKPVDCWGNQEFKSFF